MTIEAEDVLSVELEAVAGELPAWEPGAHIDLVAPGAPVRQYSLCGDPAAGRYRIAVLREDASRGGSRHVHEALRPGDVLSLRGPRNHFALQTGRDVLFIAGGIGITPLLPMVRRAAAGGTRWRLLYLGASRARMPFLDELATLGGDVAVVARDEAERADLPREVAARPNALVYACGPPRMLAQLRELIPGNRLCCEYFTAPETEYEPGGAFSVRLSRTGVELAVPPERSVLDVMREAGADVLTDCEEGICGSCETRVLEGQIEHRDFVLTAQERERNDCMMVCVSRAAGLSLVLDA
jgi:ferredoxin-NADP reductase